MLRTDQRGQGDIEGQDQKSANNILQAKSPNPQRASFLSEVLLECSHTRSFTYCPGLFGCGEESDCDKDHMACRTENIYYLNLGEKFTNSWPRKRGAG